MNKVFKNKKGITLIELLVTLLLVSIVVVFIYRLILNVNSQTTNPEFAMSNQTIRTEIIRTVEADLVSHDITKLEVVQQDEDNNYNPSIYFVEKDKKSVLSIIDEKSIQYTSFAGQTQRWEVVDCFINFDPSEEGEKSGIVYSQNGVGNSTAAVTVNIVISNENEHNSGLTEENNNLKDDILISYLAHNNDLQFCTKSSTHTEEVCKKYVLIYLDYNYPHKETESLVTSDQIVGEPIRFPDKPTTEGYIFDQWYNSKTGGSQISDDRIIKLEDENMVLYAHWTPKSVEVEFDPNGGTTPLPNDTPTKTVFYDGVYGKLRTTTRVGYTFENWRLGSERTSRVITPESYVKIPTNHTLYAYWRANQYIITLVNQLATNSGTTSLKATYDSSVLDTKIINPKREYTITFNPGTPSATLSKTSIKSTWTFDGWFTATSGGTKVIDSSGKLVANISDYTDAKGNWIRPSTATLYAQWSGGKITEPTATRTGYTCTLPTIENPPTKDATYTATCIAKTYKIILNNQNATTKGTESITATFDSATLVKITNPSRVYTITFKPGTPAATLSSTKETSTWTFTGWYTAASGGSKVIGTDGKFAKNVSGYTNSDGQWVRDEAVTLYAQWKDGKITEPTATRTGYDCSLGAITNPPTANKEYTAKCAAKTYKITLNNQNATTKGTESVTATFDSATLGKITNPSRVYTITFKPGSPAATLSSTKETSTWTFTGWWTAKSDGTKIIGTDGKLIASIKGYTDANKKWIKDGGTTLYAQWSGGTITEPTATRTGYNCSLPKIENPPTANKEYTATCTAKTYTITLNNQNATTKGTESITATYDSATLGKITNPSRIYTITFKKGNATSISSTKETSTWTFDGWYTSSSGGSKVIGTDGKFVKNVTNYTNSSSKWIKDGSATLYAHWSGGSITAPTASKTGYKCSFGSITNPPTKDATYTAACTANKYTVKFDKNGGENPSKASMEVTYDAKYGALATTSWSAHRFEGWYDSKTGGTKITKDSTVKTASDHTLYAHWTELCTSPYTYNSSDKKCHYTYNATPECPKEYNGNGTQCVKSTRYDAEEYYSGCVWKDGKSRFNSSGCSPWPNQSEPENPKPGDMYTTCAGGYWKAYCSNESKSSISNRNFYSNKTYACNARNCPSGTTCNGVKGNGMWQHIYTCTGGPYYSCDGNDEQNGTQCTHYDYVAYTYKCPNGGTLSGTTCEIVKATN